MNLLCCDCKRMLPVDKFSKKDTKRGYNSKCQECHNTYVREVWYPKNKDKQIASSRQWQKNNKARVLANRYKVPIDQVERVMDIHSCQICGVADNLVLDHCHDTLTVRGILCGACNFGIGHFRNNTELLTKAVQYLNNAQ